MATVNTVKIYQGPSEFDGEEIVVVASGLPPGYSSNRKTGPLVQTWILRRDQLPHLAVREGKDSSVCGSCTARGNGCYVIVGDAPNTLWKRLERTPLWTPEQVRVKAVKMGQGIRLGAYGDPGAVPMWVWEELLGRKVVPV